MFCIFTIFKYIGHYIKSVSVNKCTEILWFVIYSFNIRHCILFLNLVLAVHRGSLTYVSRVQLKAQRAEPRPRCCSNHVSDVRWKRWLTSSLSARTQLREAKQQDKAHAQGFLIMKVPKLNYIYISSAVFIYR